MFKMKKRMVAFSFLLLLVGLSACANTTEKPKETTTSSVTLAEGMRQKPYQDERFLLGTYTRISVYDEGKEDAIKPAFDRIKELGDKITINQPGSEIDEINQNAGIRPVKVSEDIYDLLKTSYKYSVESKGGFNMTVGAITQLWRIGFSDARKPSQEEIDVALKKVDYNKIKFNDKKQTVYLEEKGMIIDLGAIAKGYIADEAAAVLREHGVTSAIIDLGGNILVIGYSNRGDHQKWHIGIQDPNKERGSILGVINEANRTVVTSGIYERYLEVDGVKYHHIFDSTTGYPYDNDLASVTVIADHSIDGDALTKFGFSQGVKKGLSFYENEAPKGTEAIFVTRDNKVYITKGLEGNFELSADSGYVMGDENELK